jgi:hypothetical protein
MPLLQIMPIVTVIGLIVFLILHAKQMDYASPKAWVFPAVLSVVFLAFSVLAVVQEGPVGFWSNHIQNLWGNQVWFDLLIGFGLAWVFLVPRAKAVGMNVWPWIFAPLLTGNIGVLVMAARVFYLERGVENTVVRT